MARPVRHSRATKNRGALLMAALGVALGSGSADAQTGRTCPQPTGEPYAMCQVDHPPRPSADNAAPRHPDMLRHAGVGGSVRFSFVVDSTGRPDPASFRVIETTHDLFTMTAKQTFSRWRFEPGRKGGHPVAVRWQQIVSFARPPLTEAPPWPRPVVTRDSTEDGTPRMRVGAAVSNPEPHAILKFTTSELLEAQRQALLHLVPAPLSDSVGRARVTVCVTVSRGSQEDAADSATLAMLAAPGRRAVIPRDCPKTYTNMMWSTDRAPRGYIEPYYMAVARLIAWNATVLALDVEITHGTATDYHLCWAARGAHAWEITCRRTGSSVS